VPGAPPLPVDVAPDGALVVSGTAAAFPGPVELSAAVRLAAGLAPLPPDAAWADVTFDGIAFTLLRTGWQVVMGMAGGGGPRPPPQPPAPAAPPSQPLQPPPPAGGGGQWVQCARCQTWRAVPPGGRVLADPAHPGLWVCEWAGWDVGGVHPFTRPCVPPAAAAAAGAKRPT
jgi:hypothetical protein